jgi:hypothetical protein
MSELKIAEAHNRVASWSVEDTDRVEAELERLKILPPISQRWPTTMALDFYRNHGTDFTISRSQAAPQLDILAASMGASLQYVRTLLALAYLVQDSITLGFPMAIAIANNAIIREPFELAWLIKATTPFYGLKEDNDNVRSQ